jgi:CheY-like chemotaxis protein
MPDVDPRVLSYTIIKSVKGYGPPAPNGCGDNEVSKMRVLLADDQAPVRSALGLLLAQERDIDVVAEADESNSLLHRVEQVHPDLVLLDWELPGATPSLLSALRARCPSLKVIALSGRPDARQAALRAGADAFVSKMDPAEYLLAAFAEMTRIDAGCTNGRPMTWEAGYTKNSP